MLLKDYYAILELEPPATAVQIRKAFRRLAHIYHPDKNYADPYAQARFADIKEAYEVLTHPERREKYLQLRWYNSSIGKKTTADTTTPVSILKELLLLEKQLARADQYRMDREGLFRQLLSLFSQEHIGILNQFGDREINYEIIQVALNCVRYLPHEHMQKITGKLDEVVGDEKKDHLIKQYVRGRKNARRNDVLRVPALVLLVIVICLLIYFSSKK